MRQTLKARGKYSATDYLKDLGIDGCLKDFIRMNSSEFEYLQNLIGAKIGKRDTTFRKSVSVTERLAVTLRFLAAGSSYKSLGNVFKLSDQVISIIVPEVCEALNEVLKEYIQVSQTTFLIIFLFTFNMI